MSKALRPHQVDAIDRLYHSVAGCVRLSKRARIMLKLATGAGKTVIAAAIIRRAREKGRKVLFVVDALSLIDQTVQAFYAEGIPSIGVIQADHPMTDYSRPVQVASVQTLQRRGMPECDLVIVDEAHSMNEWLLAQMAEPQWAKVPFIGLSATPWAKGLGHHYDELIAPVTMQELIDLGFLSQFRVYAASHPDLTGVKTIAGDYHEGQLSDIMAEGKLMADVVDTWRQRAGGVPTFAFCVDRAHAKKLQQRFLDAGIGAGYIDAYTKPDERREVRRQLDAGEISIVCNVGCLTKGVDWAIGCVILARPTQSEMLYVQMVGRGLRVNEGIGDCIILDHADNTLRMGFVTDVDAKPRELCKLVKGERSKRERDVPLPKECPSCSYLKPPKVAECPGCGFKPERQSKIVEVDAELVEIKPKFAKASMEEKQRWFSEISTIARQQGRNSGWVSHTFREKFGTWPPRGLFASYLEPTTEVRNFVRYRAIAFAKGRRAS